MDQTGRLKKSFRATSPRKEILPLFFRRLWRAWNTLPPDILTIGIKGVWLPLERKALQIQLSGLARRVIVISDVELSFESALTPRNDEPGREAGILILAGTGSIALGRNGKGNVARAGGLGPLKGDEGSGYWIGKEYLKIAPRLKGKRDVRAVAALTKTVFRKAGRDKDCAEILRRAQGHLADLVVNLASKLNFQRAAPLTWAGSLLENPVFRRGFFAALASRKTRLTFIRVAPEQDPALAAARWGGRYQGLPTVFLTGR